MITLPLPPSSFAFLTFLYFDIKICFFGCYKNETKIEHAEKRG
jgi:hypothetical protein